MIEYNEYLENDETGCFDTEINWEETAQNIANVYEGSPRTTENENFLFESVYWATHKHTDYTSQSMNELYRMAWERVKWS